MIFRDIERQIHPQRVINKVIFDLDRLLRQEPEVGDNCLLAVAKERLKLGHSRKASNPRYINTTMSQLSLIAKMHIDKNRFDTSILCLP